MSGVKVFLVIYSSIVDGDQVEAVFAQPLDAVAYIDNLKPDWTLATPEMACGDTWIAARVSPNRCGSYRVERWDVRPHRIGA